MLPAFVIHDIAHALPANAVLVSKCLLRNITNSVTLANRAYGRLTHLCLREPSAADVAAFASHIPEVFVESTEKQVLGIDTTRIIAPMAYALVAWTSVVQLIRNAVGKLNNLPTVNGVFEATVAQPHSLANPQPTFVWPSCFHLGPKSFVKWSKPAGILALRAAIRSMLAFNLTGPLKKQAATLRTAITSFCHNGNYTSSSCG